MSRRRCFIPFVVAVVIAATAGQAFAAGPSLRLERPGALALGRDGVLYIADAGRNQIVERLPGGRMEIVAGNGKAGFSGDGGPAVRARLNRPAGLAVAADGTLFVADSANGRVRTISPAGVIRTVAAGLGTVTAIAFAPGGRLVIAAAGRGEILRVDQGGALTRLAGGKDGPGGIAFDTAGNLYAAGLDMKTLSLVSGGHMRTIGSDYPSFGGVTRGPDGRVYATDHGRILRLDPSGAHVIRDFRHRTFAGIRGFTPEGIAVDASANIYADTWLGDGWTNRTALIEIHPDGSIAVLWESKS